MDDDQAEVRAVSARVMYDGSIAVVLAVPGSDEPVEMTFPGDTYTLFMTSEESVPIDLAGTRAGDRRCQELVASGLARLNREMARQRERLGRRRQEWSDDA